MESPRIVLVLFLLFLLFSTSSIKPASTVQLREFQHSLGEEQYATGLLKESSFGNFNPGIGRWLNLTGFRETDNYAWELLPWVQSRAREQRRNAFYAYPESIRSPDSTETGKVDNQTSQLQRDSLLASALEAGDDVYQNITGLMRGKWRRSTPPNHLKPAALNLSDIAPFAAYFDEPFLRNVTGQEGDLTLHLDEKHSEYKLTAKDYVREVKAQLTLKDESSSGDGWNIALHGLHYPRHGTVLLTTTSPK